MEPIQFIKYDRITDDLYYLGKNVVLKFTVGLAYYKDGERYFFHNEYEYQRENQNVVSIKRRYDYYLALENSSIENKEFIIIAPKDFIKFRKAIQTALSWFQDTKYSKLYATNKGKLIMTSPIPSCEINSFPGGKYIKLDPVIIDFGIAKEDKQPGVCLTLSDPNNYVNMSVDTLTGLDYILSCVNMISMAQSMISAIPLDTPINRNNLINSPIGKNTNKKMESKPLNDVKTIEGRFIGQSNSMESL